MTKTQKLRLNAVVTALDLTIETNKTWQATLTGADDFNIVSSLNSSLTNMKNILRSLIDEDQVVKPSDPLKTALNKVRDQARRVL